METKGEENFMVNVNDGSRLECNDFCFINIVQLSNDTKKRENMWKTLHYRTICRFGYFIGPLPIKNENLPMQYHYENLPMQ